ncbi:MAG: DUF58 domain-containing protein [Propionibacteriaceae bacterium]|jgi:hypothetical protein|nr:DUF58 domain-containing protein [Propionibacteriaceae bacterium]
MTEAAAPLADSAGRGGRRSRGARGPSAGRAKGGSRSGDGGSNRTSSIGRAFGRLGSAIARVSDPALGWVEDKALRPLVGKLKPVVAAVKPYLAVVRPFGWAALIFAGGALVAGLILGWTELIVVGLALLTMLIVAIVFVLGRSSYAVTLDLARLRVTVGDEAFGGLAVANTADKPVMASEFALPVGRGLATFRVPKLAAKEKDTFDFQVPTKRRAVLPVGPVRSSRGDPFGLLRRDLLWTESYELFVHPQTVSLAGTSSGFMKDLEGRPTDDLSSSDIAFHALREYVVGDDLRHIHWKSSAKARKLLVRQFEETRRSHLVLCLSMAPEDYTSEGAFEMAVSATASLGVEAICGERDVTVMAPTGLKTAKRRSRMARSATWSLHTETATRLLDDCSRLDYGPAATPIEWIARDAAEAAPDASSAVMVVGAKVPPARLHAALARFPIDVFGIAIRCDPGATSALAAIGDSPVLTIGHLDDLPRALRALKH